MNQFDIPIGAAREKVGDVIYTDSTQITCMRDPQSLRYYFRTYDDETIRMIDLKSFDLTGGATKTLPINSQTTPYVDITSN